MFNWDMEFYTRYKYNRRDFASPALLYPPNHLRRDKRHNVYMALTRNFTARWFSSLTYNYIVNSSNTDLYDFSKTIFGLNVGLRY